MTIFAAVDPGLTGAIAFVYADGRSVVEDLPTLPIPGNGMVKRRIDGSQLRQMFRQHVALGDSVHFTMEDVRAMGGSAVQTMGSMMRSVGTIEAVIECMGLQVYRVEPKHWKSDMGLKAAKSGALDLARRLYPTLQESKRINLAKHDGRAEALLIAHWAKGKYS